MLIYLFTTSYPDKEYPSKNIFVYEQAKELASRGHHIIVLHVKKISSKKIFMKTNSNINIFDDGFAIRYCIVQKTLLANKLHVLNRNLFVNSVIKLYRRAVFEQGSPDVIYAHFSCWAGYAASKISKEQKIPLVTIEHYGGLLGKSISKAYVKGIEATINQSHTFLCVSDGLRKSLLQKVHASKEIFVVPNMIDRRFRYTKPIKHEKFIFLGIGNLYKDKEFAMLISAFCKAFTKDDPVVLRIGGGGPEYQHLQEIISTNDRVHQIELLGILTRERTIEEYKNCDCFVLPSNHETFGMVYREALITGRPIITTDHGGFSGSDWHNIYGYKVPVGDERVLAESLSKMTIEASSYNHKLISTTCMNDCSAERVGDKIERILINASNK